jgi:hypothetical protein
MIKMKVSDETSVNHISQIKLLAGLSSLLLVDRLSRSIVTAVEKRKVGKLLHVNHVDATIEHHGSTANLNNNTRTTNILACAEWHYLNRHFTLIYKQTLK